MATNQTQKKRPAKSKDEMWDIINPARAQTINPKKGKVEIVTPVSRSELVLPEISSASGKKPHLEREDSKQLGHREEMPEYPKSSEIPKNYEIDKQNSIRELEIALYDTRSFFEKKLKQLSEELPSKLQRELIAIQNRDVGMWKDIQTKTSILQESINVVKEAFRTQSSNWNEKINNIQKKVDETELKMIAMEKNVEKAIDGGGKKSSFGQIGGAEESNAKIGGIQTQIELSAMKEQFMDEKRKRDAQLDEMQKMLNEQEAKFRSQINELTRGVQRVQEGGLLLKPPETSSSKTAAGATKGELEYISSHMSAMEKRVDEEIGKRVRLEEDLLKYLDEKVFTIKEKMKQEEKSSLEREKKMLGNIQDGLVTINEIMKGTSEESGLKLTKVETELSHHLEALTQLVDNTNRAFASDLSKHNEELKNIKRKLIEVEDGALTNLQSISSSLQNEIFKLEGELSDSSKKLSERVEDIGSEVRRYGKVVSLTKEELLTGLAEERKLCVKGNNELKIDIEKQNNYIRERTVMLKYDMDEHKKSLTESYSRHETLVNGEITRIDKQATARIDVFCVKIDEGVRDHTTKTADTIKKFQEVIDSNKKATDEHIKQQSNAIKALCRALTEKEGAERRQALDELGLRMAKRFTELESEINKRFLNLEVDLKNYTIKKMHELEESILSDIHPKLVLDKILSQLETAERQQQINTLEQTLRNHIEAYKREMKICQTHLENLDSNLDEEVKERTSEMKSLNVHIESQFSSRDVMNIIANSLADEQASAYQQQTEIQFGLLSAKCEGIEEKLENNTKEITSSIEETKERIEKHETSINELASASAVNELTSSIAINSIESRLMASVQALERVDANNKQEILALVNKNSKEEKKLIKDVACHLDQVAAENIGEHLVNKVSLVVLNTELHKEILGMEGKMLSSAKELKNAISSKTLEIEKVAKEQEARTLELNKKLESSEKMIQELGAKGDEIQKQITSMEEKNEEKLKIQEERAEGLDKKIGEAEGLLTELGKKEASMEEKLVKVEAEGNTHAKSQETKVEELAKKIIAAEGSIADLSQKDQAVNSRLTKMEAEGSIHIKTQEAKAEEVTKKISEIESELTKKDKNVNEKIAKLETEGAAHVKLQESKVEELGKKIVEHEGVLKELSSKAKEIEGSMGKMEGERGGLSKAQEGKVEELNKKMLATEAKLIEQEKKEAEMNAKLGKIAEASAGQKNDQGQKYEELHSKIEALEKGNVELNKKATTVEATINSMDVVIHNMQGKVDGMQHAQETTEKKLTEVIHNAEAAKVKHDAFDKQIKTLEEKEKAADQKLNKMIIETDQKGKELTGTLNNEVESLQKKMEIDLSQARIDIEKKIDTSIKLVETRVKALEVHAQK